MKDVLKDQIIITLGISKAFMKVIELEHELNSAFHASDIKGVGVKEQHLENKNGCACMNLDESKNFESLGCRCSPSF